MTENLTEKGLREGIAAIDGIRTVLRARRCDAENRLAQAEADVSELRKLESYAASHAEDMARRLTAMTGEPAKDRPAL